jgi:radical SAM protein with 4Fe4S-binding SPASM domain
VRFAVRADSDRTDEVEIMIKLLKKFGYFPRACVWEMTLRCNLNCRHCGSRAGKPRPNELSLDECLKLAKDLADLHCRYLTLGGGEPLLRREWPIIAQALIERGVKVCMVTNGLAWTDEIAKTAKVLGMESIAFSLDGFEQEHDYLRRSPGLFQKVVRAIESSLNAGITTSVITTVTSQNLSKLEAIREMVGSWGMTRWQVQAGTPSGNLSDNLDLVIKPEDMLKLVPLVAKMCRDGKSPKVFPGHDIGYFGEPEEDLRDPNSPIPCWIGCTAGCSGIGIESNGNVKGCLSLPSSMDNNDAFVEGNIRTTPLRDIWFRKGAFAYNREFTVENLAGFCRTCDYAEVCRGGCTWVNFTHPSQGRDNTYCYWRQLQLARAREQGAVDTQDQPQTVHLPVVE